MISCIYLIKRVCSVVVVCSIFFIHINKSLNLYMITSHNSYHDLWGRHDHDRMVDGFITTYAIIAYHH